MPSNPTSRWQRGVVAGVGLTVLAFALPLTNSDFLRLYAESGSAFRQIDERFNDPQARISAGLQGLRTARKGNDSSSSIKALKSAIVDLNAGLARAPADPLAWLELAHAHLAVGDADAALASLNSSLAFAFYDPALSLRRSEIGLRLWLVLKDKDRVVLRDQVRYSWDREPEKLVELASRDPWIAKTVLLLLSDAAGVPGDFEKLLSRRLQDVARPR